MKELAVFQSGADYKIIGFKYSILLEDFTAKSYGLIFYMGSHTCKTVIVNEKRSLILHRKGVLE